MRHLLLYRLICEYHAKHGRAVRPSYLQVQPIDADGNTIGRTTMYKCLRDLQSAGYIARLDYGWYIPVDIYQWHIDDALRGGMTDD